MKIRSVKILAFLFLFSVLLVGCGLDEDVQGNELGEAEQENTMDENATEDGTESIDQEESSYLLEEGMFTFAMSGEYRPFNYIDEVTGELVGFDVEIGKAIAEYHGWQANPVATPWSGIISGLRSGNFDAIIGSMGITAERAEQVDFSDPYYLSGAQLFVKEGSAIQSIDDVTADMTIGVGLGTSYEPVAREYTDQVATYESDVTALRDLASSNNLDAVITDRLTGLIAIEETGFELQVAGELLFEEEVAIPVQKGNQGLLELINEALESIFKDGTFIDINNRYFSEDIGPQN